jgi:hypothetical protein
MHKLVPILRAAGLFWWGLTLRANENNGGVTLLYASQIVNLILI